MTSAAKTVADVETRDAHSDAPQPRVQQVAELIAAARARRLSDNPAETESA